MLLCNLDLRNFIQISYILLNKADELARVNNYKKNATCISESRTPAGSLTMRAILKTTTTHNQFPVYSIVSNQP